MSVTQRVDLTPIESAASRLEELQRLFACYALVTLLVFLQVVPDLLKPNQATLFRRRVGEDLYQAMVATGTNPENYMRVISIGTMIALVILLVVAMSSN